MLPLPGLAEVQGASFEAPTIVLAQVRLGRDFVCLWRGGGVGVRAGVTAQVPVGRGSCAHNPQILVAPPTHTPPEPHPTRPPIPPPHRARPPPAKALGGMEDIPEGVVCLLTRSATDVLSHVAIRARSQGVLLATCLGEGRGGQPCCFDA